MASFLLRRLLAVLPVLAVVSVVVFLSWRVDGKWRVDGSENGVWMKGVCCYVFSV